LGDYTIRTHARDCVDFEEPRRLVIQNKIESNQTPAMQKISDKNRKILNGPGSFFREVGRGYFIRCS
jgi:hypothetical protein